MSSEAQDNEIPKQIEPRYLHRTRIAVLVSSALLWMVLSFCYHLRPDFCTAVTFWPPWLWGGVGLGITILAYRKSSKRLTFAIVLLWLIFVAVFAEEPKSLIRFQSGPISQWQAARREGLALRVISLNCAGSSKAAAEVLSYDPDIVLLQESPSKEEVTTLAKELFTGGYGFRWGPDASIIARGKVTTDGVRLSNNIAFTESIVTLNPGLEIRVVSLRLVPPVMRIDLWSAEHWRHHTANRRIRRKQLQTILQHVKPQQSKIPVIFGGDLNAPPTDAVFRLLEPHLHDTFKQGGIGWGNTVLNDIPVLRIDQIWVSRHFRAMVVTARQTQYSDHRMVICDLIVTHVPEDIDSGTSVQDNTTSLRPL